MAKRAGAGSLNCRLTFLRREQTSDEWSGTRGEWVDQFTVPGRLEPRYGSNAESVMAARMQSMQPYNMTICSSEQARQVSTSSRR